MSLVTFVRDYVQDPNRIVHIPNFIFDGCRECFLYIFSFQWFRNLIYVTLTSPSFTETFQNPTLTSTSFSDAVAAYPKVGDIVLHATPYFGQSSLLNCSFLGFINGITSTFSFCAVTIVVFHVLLNENKNRAFKIAVSACFGDVSYIAFILFGFRGVIIPWLTLEPLSYVLGLTIQLFFALAIIRDNRKIKATTSRAIPYNVQNVKGDKSRLSPSVLGTYYSQGGAGSQSGQLSYNAWMAPSLFLFGWCERGGIFQNLASLGVQPSGSYLQSQKLFSVVAQPSLWEHTSTTPSMQLQIVVYLLAFIVTRIAFTWIVLSISQNLIEWKDNRRFSLLAVKDRFRLWFGTAQGMSEKIAERGFTNVLKEIFIFNTNFLHRIGMQVKGREQAASQGEGTITYPFTSRGPNPQSKIIESRSTGRGERVPLKNILRDPIAIAAVTCSLAFLPAYSTNLLITKTAGFFPEENRMAHSFFSPWDMPGEVLGNDMDHVSNRSNDNNFPEYSFFLPFYDKGDYGGWLGLSEEDVRYEPFYLWRSRRIRAPWRKTNLQEPSSIFTNDKSLFTNPNTTLQQKETTNIKPGLSLLDKKLLPYNKNTAFFQSGKKEIQPEIKDSLQAYPGTVRSLSLKRKGTPKVAPTFGEVRDSDFSTFNGTPAPQNKKDGRKQESKEVAILSYEVEERTHVQSKQEMQVSPKYPIFLPSAAQKINKYVFLRTRLTEPVLMKFNSNSVFSPGLLSHPFPGFATPKGKGRVPLEKNNYPQTGSYASLTSPYTFLSEGKTQGEKQENVLNNGVSTDTPSSTKTFGGTTKRQETELNIKNSFRISKEGRKKLVENFKKPERAKTQVIKALKKETPFSFFFTRVHKIKPTPSQNMAQGTMLDYPKGEHGKGVASFPSSGDKIGRIRAISKRVKEFKFLKKKFQFLKIKDRKKSLKKSSQSVHLKYLKVKKKKRQKLGKYIPKLRRQYPYIRNVKERKLSLFGFYLPTFKEDTSKTSALNQSSWQTQSELYKEKNKPFYWKGYPKKKDSINYKEDLNLVFRSQIGEDLDFAQEEIQARIFLNPYIKFLLNFRVDNFLSREKLIYNSDLANQKEKPPGHLVSPSSVQRASCPKEGQQRDASFVLPSDARASQPFGENTHSVPLSPAGMQRIVAFGQSSNLKGKEAQGKHDQEKQAGSFPSPKMKLPRESSSVDGKGTGKPSQPLTLKGEQDLFRRRLIISKYADTVNFLKPKSNHSYTDRIYNHQFKGTLSTARRLFSLKVKYDQPLVHSLDYKPAIENRDLALKGSLLPLSTVVKEKGESKEVAIPSEKRAHGKQELKLSGTQGSNRLNTMNLSSVFEKSCLAPLYVAWEPESRKFIYTNRYLNYGNTFSSFDAKGDGTPIGSDRVTLSFPFIKDEENKDQSYFVKDHQQFTNWPLKEFYFKNNEFFFSQLYSNSRPIDSYLSQENEKARPIALPRRVTSLNTTLNVKNKGQPTDAQNSQKFLKLEKNDKKVFLFKHSWSSTMNDRTQGTKDKTGTIQKIASSGFYLPSNVEQQKISNIEERDYPLWMIFRTLPPSQGGFLWPGD